MLKPLLSFTSLGQPKDYISGTQIYLASLQKKSSPLLSKPGPTIIGPVLVDPSAKVAPTAVLGPNVCIGAGCVINEGARIANSTILDNAVIGAHAYVHTSIVGWKCNIGRWVRMENLSVLGQEVRVSDELYVNGAKVLPFKDLTASVQTPEVIM